jgi:hypothetical protein
MYANVSCTLLVVLIILIVLQGGLWVKFVGSDEQDDFN